MKIFEIFTFCPNSRQENISKSGKLSQDGKTVSHQALFFSFTVQSVQNKALTPHPLKSIRIFPLISVGIRSGPDCQALSAGMCLLNGGANSLQR